MRNITVAALLLLGYTQAWATNPPYHAITLSTPTGTAFENLSGYMGVAGSSLTFATYTIIMDGVTGGLNASSFTAKYGVFAGTFTTPNGGNVTTSVVIGAGPSLGGTGSLSFTEGTAGATQTMQFGVINIKTDTQNTVILGGGTSLPTNIRGYQDGTSTMSVILQDGGGNVGIRTTSPGSALDDNGDATIRGQETVTSTLTVLGGSGIGVGNINGTGSGVTISSGLVVIGTVTVQGQSFSIGSIGTSDSQFVVVPGSATIPNNVVVGGSLLVGGGTNVQNYSFNASAVVGSISTATIDSLAVGTYNSANDHSFVAGTNNTAFFESIALGSGAVSENQSFVWNGDVNTSASWTGTGSFVVQAPGGEDFKEGPMLVESSMTVGLRIQATSGLFTTSATASSFFGDGSHLTGLAGSSPWVQNGSVVDLSTPTSSVVMSSAEIDGVLYAPGSIALPTLSYVGSGNSVGANRNLAFDGGSPNGNPGGNFGGRNTILTGNSFVSGHVGDVALTPGHHTSVSGAPSPLDGNVILQDALLNNALVVYDSTTFITANFGLVVVATEVIQGNAFSVGGSSFVVSAGSVSVAYQFVAGSVNMSGSSSTITNTSSVTASAFFGDGSHLSGVSSFTGGAVANVTTFQSTVTIQGGAFSVGGSSFVVTAGSVSIPYQLTAGSFGSGTSSAVYISTQVAFTVGGSSVYASGGMYPFFSDSTLASTTTLAAASLGVNLSTAILNANSFTRKGQAATVICTYTHALNGNACAVGIRQTTSGGNNNWQANNSWTTSNGTLEYTRTFRWVSHRKAYISGAAQDTTAGTWLALSNQFFTDDTENETLPMTFNCVATATTANGDCSLVSMIVKWEGM